MRHRAQIQSVFFVALLLLSCSSLCAANVVLDVKDWFNWIKSIGQSDASLPPEGKTRADALKCSTVGGTTMCILECGLAPLGNISAPLHQVAFHTAISQGNP